MGFSIDRIVALKDELEGSEATQTRLASYDIIANHLGREYIESERYGVYASKEDRTRFSWEAQDEDELLVNIPLIHQMIEDQRTVLGATRSFRVPPPAPPAPVTELPYGAPVVGAGIDIAAVDAAQAYANKLEKGISFLWKCWNMPRVQSEIAWYAVSFGTGVGVLYWDKKAGIPRFVARSPENLYAQACVDNEREVQVAIFETETLGRSIKVDYAGVPGVESLDDGATYSLLDYYDMDERVRCIEEPKLELVRAKNTINRVPVFLVPGILTPNSIWGSSMLLRAIPIEREINRLYSNQNLYLRDVTEAPMVIKDPENVPENARWNRDTTIEVGPQGGVGRAPIAEMDGNMLAMRLADMKSNLNAALDFSPLGRGEFSGNILTGKGVNALLSPNSQRMQARLQPVDPIYEDVNRCALLMWRKGRKKSVPIYGERSGSMFADSFNPKEDIDPGWVENVVYLDAAAFVDRQSARIAMLQEVRGTPRLMSLRRYLELNPDCDDPELEMARIKAELLEEAQAMAEAQAAMQQAAAPPQDAAAENLAAEKGGAIPGGAPTMQAAPPSETAPPGDVMSPGAPLESMPGEATGMGEPGLETVEAVADVFRDIQNIKGRVWLVGAAVDGLTPEELATSFLEVALSDAIDKQTILNALRKTPLAGFVEQQRVTWHTGEGVQSLLDRVPNVEVTPGSEGYEPTPGVEQEEMPEEAMMELV